MDGSAHCRHHSRPPLRSHPPLLKALFDPVWRQRRHRPVERRLGAQRRKGAFLMEQTGLRTGAPTKDVPLSGTVLIRRGYGNDGSVWGKEQQAGAPE